MNILIPPIVNMPRVCDECPEDLCLIGYTPPCPSQCYDFDFTCEPIYNSYECSGTFKKKCTECGAFFASTSNSVKYCPVCRKRITRRQAAERMRKRRAPVTQ